MFKGKSMKTRFTMDEVFNGIEKQAEARNDLADRLSKHIGAFDKTGMSTSDVAKYGCDKLNLEAPAGQHESYLSGYLTGHAHAKTGGSGMDAAAGRNWFSKQSGGQ
jgi:hypothetical protein